MKKIIFVSLGCLLLCITASARNTSNTKSPANLDLHIEATKNVSDHELYPVQFSPVQATTTFLAYYTFDNPPSCVEQGWTSIDLTAQLADYFHVSDFTTPPENCGPGTFGGLYAPQGSQALWCGLCPSTAEPYCSYADLPGYGNNWDQAFCSPCVVTADTMITLDYMIVWDSEPDYDFTYLEWDMCDETWVEEGSVNGGTGAYDGLGALTESIAVQTGTGQFSFRFHFVADGAWSDEDGVWDTDGGVIIDSLTVRDSGGILVATEDFEGLPVGSTSGVNWQSCTPPGYGDLAQLISAVPTPYQNDPVQEDPCDVNFSCLWNFYKGSTFNYACNTPNPSPQQQVVPYMNARDQYIWNQIWSPYIPYVGTGTVTDFSFDVYRDLPMDPLVFYQWSVRGIVGGCPACWGDRSFVFYGSGKDWLRSVNTVGDLIPPGASHIQISLGVIDMCRYWCGIVGSGYCHSHAPLFDNVSAYRVSLYGPQFNCRDIDMFQDNFSTDGTITGTARADMANDIISYSNPNIRPGDSSVVTVNDPVSGLAIDPLSGIGPAVYCYISVDPNQYTGADKQAPETRGAIGYRFPYVNTVSAAGRIWDVYRMDTCFTSNGGLVADRYCIDLNDNFFIPGDTIHFFRKALNISGQSSYYSIPAGQTSSLEQAAAAPDEFTILPAVGDEPGNDILYVDGMNFRGAQPYFDSAFQNMNLLHRVDRYDIRGPSSGVGNHPGSRATPFQLLGVYRKIIWNSGDLYYACLGDGLIEKSDDASLLFNWINLLENEGGIYFSGDDFAQTWATLTGPGAIALRAYCAYTVVSPNHAAYGLGVSPLVTGVPGGFFSHMSGDDTMFVYGGCPMINDFDVLANLPGVSDLQAEYSEFPVWSPGGPITGGAIVSQTTTNTQGYDVMIILSGFSYHYIRDWDADGIVDRFHHMYDIITALNNVVDEPIPVITNTRKNSLAQNYPNPFNPRTTIKYTIKEPALVSLRIYNVAGQLVKTLVNKEQRPEEVKPVEWNGLNNAGQEVSSGVYFYKLVIKDFAQTKKMVLLK